MPRTCSKCGAGEGAVEFAPRLRQCVECHKAYHAAYREANKARRLEQIRAWIAANPERHRENTRRAGRAYAARNKVKRARWTQENAEKSRAYGRQWQKAHPDKVAEKRARRRAKTKGANDPRIRALYEIAAWLRSRGDDVHVDHVIPLAKNGPHSYENLQILPAIENMRKGARLLP